jgi:hypothetical protein
MRWMREMEAERQVQALKLRASDSERPGFTAKVPADHPDYKAKVAEPTMRAVDGLDRRYRDLVKAYDYVDVYRGWLRRIPPEIIERRAQEMGGRFVL